MINLFEPSTIIPIAPVRLDSLSYVLKDGIVTKSVKDSTPTFHSKRNFVSNYR